MGGDGGKIGAGALIFFFKNHQAKEKEEICEGYDSWWVLGAGV